MAYGSTVSHWRSYLDISTSETATTVTITAKGGMQSLSWGYDLNGVHYSLSGTGQSGASGSHSFSSSTGQTKKVQFASKTWTISKGHAAQSITAKMYIKNATGYHNGSSTASQTVSIPARGSYSVSYNANGGSGAPGASTKWHDEALTLSGTRPTRTNYTFLGWATSASGSVAYQPGSSYTANANVTLYAQWRLNLIAPKVTALSAVRCDADGTSNDEGSSALIATSWKIDTALHSDNNLSYVRWRSARKGASWGGWSTLAASGTTGTASAIIGPFDVANGYTIQVEVKDTYGSAASRQVTLSPSSYTIDLLAGGHGVSFGKAATREGLDIAWPIYQDGSIATDANSALTSLPADSMAICQLASGHSGGPNTYEATLISRMNVGGKYGAQLAMNDRGVWFRSYSNSVFQPWALVAPITPYTPPSNLVKYARTGWGTTLSFVSSGTFLLIVNATAVYIGWVNGTQPQLTTRLVGGSSVSNLTFEYNSSSTTVTITRNTNSTFFAIYS